MFYAALLRCATELSRGVEHIRDQRATAHLGVADLRILTVLGTENAQSFTIGPVPRIVEVTEHHLAFDARLEDRAEGRLRFVLQNTDGISIFISKENSSHKKK